MVGSSLLVKPVTDEGSTSVDVYLPGKTVWYDLHTLKAVPSSDASPQRIDAPLDTIPVFIRGGSILPRKCACVDRRSSCFTTRSHWW